MPVSRLSLGITLVISSQLCVAQTSNLDSHRVVGFSASEPAPETLPEVFPTPLLAPVFSSEFDGPFVGYKAVRLADFNQNGVDEFVLIGQTDLVTYRLRGGVFELEHRYELPENLVGDDPRRLNVIDLDSDGHPDLTKFSSRDIYWNDDGVFTRSDYRPLPDYASSERARDIDGDGILDFYNQGGTRVAYGRPARAGYDELTIDSGFTGNPLTPVLNDFDADGDLDLFGAGTMINGVRNPIVLVNNGDRTFTEFELTGNRFNVLGHFATIDTTGDGVRELIYTTTENAASTLLVVGGGDTGLPEILERIVYPNVARFDRAHFTRVLDIDGDGEEEVLMAGRGTLESRSPGFTIVREDSIAFDKPYRIDTNDDARLDFVQWRWRFNDAFVSLKLANEHGFQTPEAILGDPIPFGYKNNLVTWVNPGPVPELAFDAIMLDQTGVARITESHELELIPGSAMPTQPDGIRYRDFIDLDADGILDAVYFRDDGQTSQLLWRRQFPIGFFQDPPTETPPIPTGIIDRQYGTDGVQVYDLLGDGRPVRVAVLFDPHAQTGENLSIDRPTPTGLEHVATLPIPPSHGFYRDLRPLFAVDFDRDGIKDLVYFDTSPVLIYPGLPGGGYADPIESPEILSAGQSIMLGVYDLDGDGHDDLLINTPYGSGNITLVHNNATFSPNIEPLDLCLPFTLHPIVLDLDGDHIDDLLLPYSDSPYIYAGLCTVIRGSQRPPTNESLETYLLSGVLLADATQDGLPDTIGLISPNVPFGKPGFYDRQVFGDRNLSCANDLNHDGVLDIADLMVFIKRFTSGDPSADLNGDGATTGLDVRAMVRAIQNGCDD